ncbi:hypothetical protein BGZ73_008336 [Actinomortierella ambigua]|nr:hypothetical protein BGZ73_008336 [Actinomortierella ambigua]
MTSKPSPSSLSSAAQSQPHPQQQRGIVPISHEILSSLTMILLHHPSQKQRQVEANQPGGKTAVYQGRAATDDETTAMSATEDGCDLEDWLLEAVYNLLEHETYKGQVMAETLGEYIVRVALARERRYRSQRSRYEQQQQQQSQSQQRIYPEYHGIREHERQRLEDDEDDQVQVEEGQDFPNEEVETGYDEVEDHPEQLPVDGSFEAQDVEAELDRAQEEEVEVGEDEEEDEHAYPPRDVDPSNQRAGDSLSHDRPLAYSLYHHARFRWSQGVEGSSDVGDVPTSDIAAAPSELASELATDMQLSEPPTELGEPIKLVMLSEDCFGARAGPGDDGSVGNESFRRLRGPVEDGDDDDDDHDDGDHGEGDDHEEDSTLAVASHTGAAGHPNRRMLAPKEIEELAEQPPSDLPYEVHDISRIDLGSDLGPLIQELAEDKDLEDLYPLDPAASPQDGEDDQEARLQDHGLMFLATTENIAPPPSEDWA